MIFIIIKTITIIIFQKTIFDIDLIMVWAGPSMSLDVKRSPQFVQKNPSQFCCNGWRSTPKKAARSCLLAESCGPIR